MKKYLDYLYLLAPALVWWLSSQVLGDQFSMPNRLMLAALCTAAGAGAMITNRKLPGVLALVAGLAMLASVPVEHEVPESSLTLRLSGYDISTLKPDAQTQILSQDKPSQILLFSPGMRCLGFVQTASETPSLQEAYVVGS